VDEKVYKILLKKKDLFDIILGDSVKGALKNPNLIDNIFDELVKESKNL